jgi:transaldolase/glucose-6-phosphate isomerase
VDVPIPDQKFSFGVLKRAQAQGDFQVLCERGRRILRVHLPAAVEPALAKLVEAVKAALP